MYYLGFDIGGSSVKEVLVKEKRIIKKTANPLPKSFELLIELLLERKKRYADLIKPQKIKGVGISIAGPLDKKRERVVYGPNIKYLTGKKIYSVLSKKFQPCPVKIEHDIHCFLRAEKILGNLKSYKNVFYLALGTGIGGAMLINNEMIIGSHGSAGEIGHMILDIKGKTVWEECAANKLIRKKLKIDALKAKEMASHSDKKALETFREMGENLGIGIANIINILDPEVIIIGGGLIKAKKYFLPSMKKAINQYVISSEAKKTKIRFSSLGRFGGALGAALLHES